MDSFKELLHKVLDAHEREVEGWQIKVQELSNKKGCDTKRMEELFSRNQQMREQQRVLTENIKTLENRLRAGLCDRCTVTQEVAKRREQEYEVYQIQSLQHISILAGEINNLKKDNKKLKEEVRSLRGVLIGQSEQSSNSITPEVKPVRSPEISSPLAFITAASKSSMQIADGDVLLKTEPDQRSEAETQHRIHVESTKPVSVGPTTEYSVLRGSSAESRSASNEPARQTASVPALPLLLKSMPSAASASGGEHNHSRHLLHSPVPYRPRPIKSGTLSLPWPMSEGSEWVTLTASAGGAVVVQPNPRPKPNPPHYPNLIPVNANHNASQSAPVKQTLFGQRWPKPSPPQGQPKEQPTAFRVQTLSEQGPALGKVQESQSTRVFGEGLRQENDSPLDLSDRARPKLSVSQSAKDDNEGQRSISVSMTDSSVNVLGCSSSSSPSAVSADPANLQQDANCGAVKQKEEERSQSGETNGKAEQSNGKKVPVLTISLQPVVQLENINSTLMNVPPSSKCKHLLTTVDTENSSEDQDNDKTFSGLKRIVGSKRKRSSATDSDRESDTDIQQEKNFKSKVETTERTTM